MRDAIVIGKGPAGISAAIYLKRAGIDVLVIGKGYGALENSDKIENFYGFEEPISGKELIEKGIKQAENLGIEVITDEVVSIEKYENFIVKTLDKSFEAKTVLLATGKSRVKIDIKGFEKFKGKGISFCAVCDGFFYRNKKVAVIGNGKYAANELSELMNFTKDIILFTNGQDLTTDNIPDDIDIVYDKISEIYGDDKIKGLIAGNTNFDVDGIFIALGTASASDFAMKMGVFTEKDSIIVDEDFMTNVEGFYAAGDAIGGFLQIAKAVSDGAHASKGMIKYIKKG
jgi:thioredoxin reductase (NADPH)